MTWDSIQASKPWSWSLLALRSISFYTSVITRQSLQGASLALNLALIRIARKTSEG